VPIVIASVVPNEPHERVEFSGGTEAWDRAWNYALELGYEFAERGYKVIPDPADFTIAATGEDELVTISVAPDEPEMETPC
jgi:hypothetical protein